MEATKKTTLAVADILLFQQQLRRKLTLTELGYFLVNDSQKIAPYQIGVFYRHFRNHRGIEAISGLPMPVKEAPFYIWLNKLCKEILRQDYSEPQLIKAETLPPALVEQWDEFLPSEILWLPLVAADGEMLGGLLFARVEAWKPDELRILQYWSGTAAHTVELLSHKKHSVFAGLKQVKTIVWLALAAALILILFIPISMSVLAQAEVVAKNPVVVRAPLEGVIGEVFAQPNKAITKEQLLLTLDGTSLKSRLDVAVQELEIAKAEYRRAEQVSVTDRDASAEMPMLAARIEQRTAEVEYINSLLERIHIHADVDGIAIIPDAYELEGKPVKLGERLLTIAKLDKAELEMWLAIGDSIALSENTEIELFLNVSPETPFEAKLRYVNFQAEMSPEGLFAFRARGDFPTQEKMPRIGLRGIAKIYGEKVPLYYYLFRRPYAAVRQWIGI